MTAASDPRLRARRRRAGRLPVGIAGFRAEPNVICGGSQTTLSWSATTDGTLSAVPADASLGPVAATGTRTVSPAGPTTYRLTVKRLWKTATREAAVEVVAAPSEAKQIGASVADPSTTCEGNTLALTVTAPAGGLGRAHQGRARRADPRREPDLPRRTRGPIGGRRARRAVDRVRGAAGAGKLAPVDAARAVGGLRAKRPAQPDHRGVIDLRAMTDGNGKGRGP